MELKERIFGLDLMRAIAIMLVVVVHGDFILQQSGLGIVNIPLPDGVELFFVLSGFLIGTILLRIFEKGISDRATLISFWKRRWWRTLPNYYLILILNILLVYTGVKKSSWDDVSWTFFLFFQNFSTHFTGFFWESWSLSVEEWFYIFFPLILFAMFRLFKKSSPKSIFLFSTVLFILIPLILRIYKASYTEVDAFWLPTKFHKIVILRLDSIGFGILAAYFKRHYIQSWISAKNYLFIAGLAFIFAPLFYPFDANSFYLKVLHVNAVSIGSAMLIPFFDQLKTASRMVALPVTFISLISYSMYLTNLTIAELIATYFLPEGNADSVITYLVYLTVVIGLSALLYRYFEKPMMNMRDKQTRWLSFKRNKA